MPFVGLAVNVGGSDQRFAFRGTVALKLKKKCIFAPAIQINNSSINSKYYENLHD